MSVAPILVFGWTGLGLPLWSVGYQELVAEPMSLVPKLLVVINNFHFGSINSIRH